jgi:DNA polymerase-3 subunit delta'
MTHPWLEGAEKAFLEQFSSGRLPHALLISGPSECGKVKLGQRFLAAALCLENRYPACGNCRSCQLLASGAHPDGHVLTFEENPRKAGELRKELVIDQVRKLTETLYLTTTISRRKAALIYPVEAMNKHTANALLKTLEEPPGDTVLLLVSHDPDRLPATIRSRCQDLHVRVPDKQAALRWLTENAGCDERQGVEALRAAAGSPLRAKRMLSDGGTDEFVAVCEALDHLQQGMGNLDRAMAVMIDVDPERLWSWISLQAAQRVRNAALAGQPAKSASELQYQADRNRLLSHSPVRKDLLLQDWLIQWARLNA